MNLTLRIAGLRVRVSDDQHWLTEPRVKGGKEAGEWTSGGGGGSASIKGAGITSEWTGSSEKKKPGAKPITGHAIGHGYSDKAQLIGDVIHTSDVHDATRALYEGRKVELRHIDEVATLIKQLGKVTARMIALGEKAPVFNLCKVAVEGTNLFCAKSKGIPRAKMPQLDKEQTKAFIEYLGQQGYKTEKDKVRSDHLRATQDELNGAKVAAVAAKIKADPSKAKRIIVSRDNYILDGHHHWGAEVGLDAKDGHFDHKTKVTRVDISITDLLRMADKFTGGKNHQGMSDEAWTNEPREPKGGPGGGRWTKGGGAGGSEGESQEWQESFEASGHVSTTETKSPQWMSEGENVMRGRGPGEEGGSAGGLSEWKENPEKNFPQKLAEWETELKKLQSESAKAKGAWEMASDVAAAKETAVSNLGVSLKWAQGKNAPAEDIKQAKDMLDKAASAYAEASSHAKELGAKYDKAGAALKEHQAKKPKDPRPWAEQMAEQQGRIKEYERLLAVATEDVKDLQIKAVEAEARFADLGSDDPRRQTMQRAADEASNAYQKAITAQDDLRTKLNAERGRVIERPLGESDPRVLDVGGDEWNKKTAERLEREYEKAKPEIERLVQRPEQDVDSEIASAPSEGKLKEAAPDKEENIEKWENVSGPAQYATKKFWQEHTDLKGGDPEQEWLLLSDADKFAYGEANFMFYKSDLKGYVPEDTDGDEGEPDYAAAWVGLPDKKKLQIINSYDDEKDDEKDMEFSKLSAWGKYNWAKQHHPEVLEGTDPPPIKAAEPGEDYDEENEYLEPSEWDNLDSDQQEAAKAAYISANWDSEVESDIENYNSEIAPQTARESIVANFNSGHDTEWVTDALTGSLDFAGQKEEPTEGVTHIPFTAEQIMGAITFGGKGDTYSSSYSPDIKINDEALGEPEGWSAQSETLPGIEAEKPSDRLTDAMRSEIIDAIKGAFDKRVDKALQDDNYQPDSDSIQESLEESWDSWDNDSKFGFVTNNTSIIEDAKEQWESDHPKDDGDSTSYESGGAGVGPRVVPQHFDPMESYNGNKNTHGASEDDYRKTQKFSRWLSVHRAVQVLKKRGLVKDTAAAKTLVNQIDKQLWNGWKESSHGNEGLLLQQAIADELGGHMRHESIDADAIRKANAYRAKQIGGYEGLKAYVRAKWETTQYMLDKADMPVVDLYRSISLDSKKLDEQRTVIPGETPEQGKQREAEVKKLQESYISLMNKRDASAAKLDEMKRNLAASKPPRSWYELDAEKRDNAKEAYIKEYLDAHPGPAEMAAINEKWNYDMGDTAHFEFAQAHGLVVADEPITDEQRIVLEMEIEKNNNDYKEAYEQANQTRVKIKSLQAVGEKALMPDLYIERNGALSTTLDRAVANNWGDGPGQVVMRLRCPRTAVISVPAYGINVHSEKEVVVGGLAYHGWDAWRGKAPDLSEEPMTKPDKKTLDAMLPNWMKRKGKELHVDIFAMEIEENLPNWLKDYRPASAPEDEPT